MSLLSLLPLFGLHVTWPKREEKVGGGDLCKWAMGK